MRSSHPVLIAVAGAGLLLGLARAAEPAAPPSAASAAPQSAQPPPGTEAPAPNAGVPPAPSAPAGATEASAAPAAPAASPPAPAAPAPNAQAATPTPAPTAPGPHLVDSIAALQAAISAAGPGDTITVKNGVYTTSAPLLVDRAGRNGQPITIAAESVGGVEIGGSSGFHVAAPAAYVVISGFVLSHAQSGRAAGLDSPQLLP